MKGTPVMEATVTRGDEESWKKVNEREIREREREREAVEERETHDDERGVDEP